MNRPRTLHRNQALRLLADGHPHRLRLWKLKTGDILCYESATLKTRHIRGGTHTVLLHPSGEIRTFRDITLFEIDHMKIYM